MANQQHIKWLLEGATAWNARRERDDFVPDFEEANLAKIFKAEFDLNAGQRIPLATFNLSHAKLFRANLSSADLWHVDFRQADLSFAFALEADLTNADLSGARLRSSRLCLSLLHKTELRLADMGGADLRGAKIRKANFRNAECKDLDCRSGPQHHDPFEGLVTVLDAQNLTQAQLDEMRGDDRTIIPDNLTRPMHWLTVPTPAPPPNLPPAPKGNDIALRDNKLTLGDDTDVPKRSDLEGIFEDLRETVVDFRTHGNLSNQSPLLAAGIERFLRRIPDSFGDLEQVRFGVALQTLQLQYSAEKAHLQDVAPEKTGYIDAVIMNADLIVARLPEWQAFLEEEAEEAAQIEARVEDVETILEHAASALSSDPENFDASLFERIREYLDDKTIYAYLASKDLLVSIAHRTFTLARDLADDTVSETRKQVIRNIAFALQVQLGAILSELAGILPRKLRWLVAWLDDYLPMLLNLS